LNSASVAACAGEHFNHILSLDCSSAGNLFTFVHLSGAVRGGFGTYDLKWGLMSRVGNLATGQPRLGYHCGRCFTFKANSRVSGENELGLPPQKPCDLARNLVACEADASTTSLYTGSRTVRVYERLRRQLSAAVGTDSFQAIASRALALAKSESHRLGTVLVVANGDLCGLSEVESRKDTDEDGEVGIALIAQLLGLFLAFLGETTTLRLIEDLRLQVAVRTEPVTPPTDTIDPAPDGPAMAAAFEDLLLEIDRLRNVSARIETLADKHPGMEDGLVSVAGNILSIATVLDVFTLIRSKAGGSEEDEPNPETNRYMN
jgi:hypothetical protein